MKIKNSVISLLIILTLVNFKARAEDVKLSKDAIDQVVTTMTLEEKANLLVGLVTEVFFSNSTTIGKTESLVSGAAGTTKAIDRLGITPSVLADGPAGLRINPTRKSNSKTYYCTGFPVGTCLASTWNTDLVQEVGHSIGSEVLEYGVDILLAPGMNIMRNPLCGRNFEYFSEDPLLTGKIASSYVNGVQSNGVGVSLKHFAANNQETNRSENDSRVSQRTLREIYLKGFEIAVKESQPWTIMSSYNKLNGKYTQANRELLTDILRDEWNFKGIVMTDWTLLRNTAGQVEAGNDLFEPGIPQQVEEIISKVKSGELSIESVDTSVKRMLEYIVKTPRYNGYKYNNSPSLQEHAKITRQSAVEGMVLLKNDFAALPLKDVKEISLFGVNSYDFIAGGTGSGDVNKAYVVDLLQGITNAGYKMNDELGKLYKSYVDFQRNLIASQGSQPWFIGKPKLDELPIGRTFIENLAKQSDIGIITFGRNAGEGNDRKVENDFELTNTERILLNDVCNTFHSIGKKVIVILNIGGVIETASWKNLPDAILLAWQPGQEGGNSVADVLSGKVNPSGKLTMTFPMNIIDHPSSLNFPLYPAVNELPYMPKEPKRNQDYTEYQEGIYVGYRYFETAQKKVSYPFGFGLSYTEFSLSSPIIKSVKDGFVASVTVKNIGEVPGKEVVQLYISAPENGLEKPTSELKGFAKTRELQPGESQTMAIKVDNYDLASFDENQSSWISAKGKYILKFGVDVQDIRVKSEYTLKDEEKWKVKNVLKPEKPINELSLINIKN